MLETLRRGSTKLLWAGEGGVLLYDRGSGAYMLTVRNRAALDGTLPLLPVDCDLLMGHDLQYRDELAGRLGLWKEELRVQAAWTAPEPPGASAFGGGLHLLEEGRAPYVREYYNRSDIGGLEYIRQAIGAGMLEAFVDGTLASSAGFHGEGFIGLLEMLPACRRRGLGEALPRGAVRLTLERGQHTPGQVLINNAPSLALQKKVGMTLSEQPLYWLFHR